MTQRDEPLTGSALEAWQYVTSVADPDCLVPAYVILASVIRYVVIQGGIPVGSPMPTEAELAERYGVSRDTVRRAYAVLRQYGGVVSRQGTGHFVGRSTPIEYVKVAVGSKVTARSARPEEVEGVLSPIARALRTPILIVEEPCKPRAIYDASRTVLSFADPDGC